jgi:hypothetical protein
LLIGGIPGVLIGRTGFFHGIELPLFVDDQARAPAEADEGPGPLEYDDEAVLEADQVVDMD